MVSNYLLQFLGIVCWYKAIYKYDMPSYKSVKCDKCFVTVSKYMDVLIK